MTRAHMTRTRMTRTRMTRMSTSLGRPAASQRESASSADGSAASYWAEWNHIDSSFVSVGAAFDTSGLPTELRLYLPLLWEMLFKLPCTLDDGTKMSKDEFVAALQAHAAWHVPSRFPGAYT